MVKGTPGGLVTDVCASGSDGSDVWYIGNTDVP